MRHVQIPPLVLLAIVLTVIEVTVSMNVRIEMNVPKKVTLVTLMPLVRIPMEATIVNAMLDGKITVSNAKISMNVLQTLTLVTRMPLVRILLEATIVNATRDGEVMVSAVPISMNVRKKLITAMAWQGA